MNDLGVIDGERSGANDPNDVGQIVGWSQAGDGEFGPAAHAFLWERGTFTDLGTLSDVGKIPFELCCGSAANAINDLGEVVGEESGGFSLVPFVWLPDSDYGLNAGINALMGFEAASARDINNHGEIVGKLPDTDIDPEGHGYVWLSEPKYGLPAGVNLVTVPFQEGSAANAVNDLGQIVGTGSIQDDRYEYFIGRAFLLTPIIPIPAVSAWGTIVILLLLLSVGTGVFRRLAVA